jgi:drug/metabolite transporter (DMT)-like permease
MNADNQIEVSREPTHKAFRNYGSIYGSILGLVIGVLLAGPNFQIWTPFQSLITIFGAGLVIGLIGHFAYALSLSGVGAANADDYVIPSPNEAVTANDIGD